MAQITTWPVSIKATNFDRYVRHFDFLARLDEMNKPTNPETKDACFTLVPGLADPRLLSILSYNYENHYLRHQGFRLKLQKYDSGDQQFAADATFALVPSLERPGSGKPYGVSFESYNFPGHYLRHQNYEIWLAEYKDEPLYRQDASFTLMNWILQVLH